MLTGNGKSGILLKVDLLDQANSRQTRLLWLCISALIPILIGLLINVFSSIHNVNNASAHTGVVAPKVTDKQ